MKHWRVSRYADDAAIPSADAPEESVAKLPIDDNCDEMAFFPVSRDRTKVRRRNYKLTAGELACTLDRPATDEESERVFKICDKLTVEGHEGVHGIGEVDGSEFCRSTVQVHGPVGSAIAYLMSCVDTQGNFINVLETARAMRRRVVYGSRTWMMWNSVINTLDPIVEHSQDIEVEWTEASLRGFDEVGQVDWKKLDKEFLE